MPLVLLAGAGAWAQTPGGGSGSPGKQRLVNLVTFDVALCWPPLESMPAAADGATVTGALLSARPAMLECLVAPSARGQAAETKVVVQTTLEPGGARTTVTGDNLSASGRSCVERAVEQVPWKSPPKNTKPVVGALTVQHGPTSPAVKFGVNEASDVAGKVRLALKDWCDCFSAVGDGAPPVLEAKLTIKKGRASAASFEKGEGGLAMCLLPRLQAMDFLASAQDLLVPVPLLLVNSQAQSENPAAAPDLQFSQLDAIRGRRAAKLAMAVGARNLAVVGYDALVALFKKKAPGVQLKHVKEGCLAMLRADDALIDANQKQLEVDEKSLKLAKGLSSKDLAWTEAAKAAQQQVDASSGDLQKAQAARDADLLVCPKEHF